MGRARVFQRAAKVVLADCLQPGNLDFVWRTTFIQRQQLAMMPNQRCVGTIRNRALARETLLCKKCEVDRVKKTWVDRLVGLVFLLPHRRADPAVAITRLAIAQTHTMEHAIALEQVIVLLWRKLQIRPVPNKHPFQIRRQFADNFQIVRGDFLVNRGSVALQKRIVRPLFLFVCRAHGERWQSRGRAKPDTALQKGTPRGSNGFRLERMRIHLEGIYSSVA